ncbi:hypothetical protein PV326_011969 [Microctonus aethiopoides]|uniref:Uncharacterized protein n=1 Tax=Microctonus aethiopoides TaxID=144406 RepID=A0AA39KWK5_9HYME|nr:hypothetical protein PV326_011969 [Microctonus aethiopoides]KAK0176425.1 hypothetical protein PV328_000559 [Microctonus aethiopoides]
MQQQQQQELYTYYEEIQGENVNGLIIPEELPTILSLIYSNIPPIKKGTDSRVGVGFRLGEHADFQVLFEIGPQKETEPIGNTESKRRRQIMLDSAIRGEYGPWAQSVAKFNIEKMKEREVAKLTTSIDNNGKNKNSMDTNWLLKWSKEMAKIKGSREPSENTMIQKIRMNNGR